MTTSPRLDRGPAIAGGLMLLIALVLAIGGVWLAALGGSWYYVFAAVLLGEAGALLLRCSPLALWVYAVYVLGTLAWA